MGISTGPSFLSLTQPQEMSSLPRAGAGLHRCGSVALVLWLISYLWMWCCRWDFSWQKGAGCKMHTHACYQKCTLSTVIQHSKVCPWRRPRVFRTFQAMHYYTNPSSDRENKTVTGTEVKCRADMQVQFCVFPALCLGNAHMLLEDSLMCTVHDALWLAVLCQRRMSLWQSPRPRFSPPNSI